MQLSSVLPLFVTDERPLTIWKKRTLNIVIPGHMMIRHREKKAEKERSDDFLEILADYIGDGLYPTLYKSRRSISPEDDMGE